MSNSRLPSTAGLLSCFSNLVEVSSFLQWQLILDFLQHLGDEHAALITSSHRNIDYAIAKLLSFLKEYGDALRNGGFSNAWDANDRDQARLVELADDVAHVCGSANEVVHGCHFQFEQRPRILSDILDLSMVEWA